MIDERLTKLIDFIFLYQKDFNGDEKLYWDTHWNKMIDYYKKYGEIFEIRNKWDFYCNEALHSYYKEIVKETLDKDFKNLKCIEVGYGGCYESALMAQDGAEVTVLDYSEKAIEYVKIVSGRVVF
jgi:2-polyprenyl-3-methyl-5-hydroxy-6-metoxy-1,4-benzoquinol methylase